MSMLDILADNRHLNIHFQKVYAMLQINIERLPSYQKGMEKGMEEGAHRKALAVAECSWR
ncbi:MAG: hypothetical protein P9F75_21560 [Candidatus Contendobacter sp.]|nr:hypothetical protein [Candidatus Contendobacter sp.]